MKRGLVALALSASSLAACTLAPKPQAIPAHRDVAVHIYYDEEMRQQYGDGMEQALREIITRQNTMWNGLADKHDLPKETLTITEFTLRPSRDDVTGRSYHRSRFWTEIKADTPDGMAMYFLGQPSFILSDCKPGFWLGSAPLYGEWLVMYAGKMTGQRPYPLEEIAWTFYHEYGHTKGAWDFNIPGSPTVYCAGKPKGERSEEIDIGNMQRIREYRGKEKEQHFLKSFDDDSARLSGIFVNGDEVCPLIREMLHHESVPCNKEYARAKQELLDAGVVRNHAELEEFFAQHEQEPQPLFPEDNTAISPFYWKADAAYKEGKYPLARAFLNKVAAMYDGADGRIREVLNAAERAVDKAVREYLRNPKAASTSLRSK